MQKTDYLGKRPRHMRLGTIDFVNVICQKFVKVLNRTQRYYLGGKLVPQPIVLPE